MRSPLLALLPYLIVLATGCSASESARGEPQRSHGAARAPDGKSVALASASERTGAESDTASKPLPLVARPDVVRGLYVNRWAALGSRMWQLIELAKRTEVNALVIDVKDDRGFLLYRSSVELARAIGADTNRPMSAKRVRAVLDTMRAHGIFPIARIVVAKDPYWRMRIASGR